MSDRSIIFTFAVVNWNTRDLLDRCLASLYEVGYQGAFEVLVADNGSTDGSQAMVREKYPDVILVENQANLGFAGGHEVLFRRSRGRFHVLVNSDVRVRPGALETIQARLEAEPDIGVLGCRQLNDDGSLQPSCRRFPTPARLFVDALGLGRLLPRSRFWNGYKMGDFDHQQSRDVDQVMGAFFVIRAELIEKIGYLDTGFFMYFEEVDYCRRAGTAGFRVFFEAQAEVYHVGGGSADKVKVSTVRRAMRSLRRYLEKHYGKAAYVAAVLIVSLELVTHVLWALLRRRSPLMTLKAYGFAWLDVFFRAKADCAEI